jgi:hypothetical protein
MLNLHVDKLALQVVGRLLASKLAVHLIAFALFLTFAFFCVSFI